MNKKEKQQIVDDIEAFIEDKTASLDSVDAIDILRTVDDNLEIKIEGLDDEINEDEDIEENENDDDEE